jgi:CelD/BcsL family acetyltransferase involved in cellulose biosynthesis
VQQITLTPIDDFAALGSRWQALEAASDGGFFRSWVFLGCEVETRFAGARLLCVQRDGQDVALALLCRAQGRSWLNETGDRAADSVFIEHNGMLVRRGHADAVAPALRFALRQAGSLVLSGIDDATLRDAGAVGRLDLRQTRLAPNLDLSALKTPFLATLSANARAQIRRSIRLYGPELRLDRAATLEQAEAWFDELVFVHQAAWRRRGGPGAFAEPSIIRFHKTLIRRAWPLAQADLLRVSAGSQHIGTLYAFVAEGRVLSYQSGFSYEADARKKPGLVCHTLAIEAYAKRGLRIYDLLAGADRYKKTLAQQGENLHWAAIHRPLSARGLAASAKALLSQFIS